MDERISEVRIQYRDELNDIFGGRLKRNELVVRIQPNEAVYVKIMIKQPGVSFKIVETELDLTYSHRFKAS